MKTEPAGEDTAEGGRRLQPPWVGRQLWQGRKEDAAIEGGEEHQSPNGRRAAGRSARCEVQCPHDLIVMYFVPGDPQSEVSICGAARTRNVNASFELHVGNAEISLPSVMYC